MITINTTVLITVVNGNNRYLEITGTTRQCIYMRQNVVCPTSCDGRVMFARVVEVGFKNLGF